jgi:Fe-S oxidoreductase/nitrate reductase gamma subunit
LKALLTSLDVLLVTMAVMVMGIGLARKWSYWQSKKEARPAGNWAEMLKYLMQQREILRRPAVGVAHLCVFWGVVLPMLVIIAAQFGFILPVGPARILHLLQDLLGLFILLGTLYLLRRRLALSSEQGPQRTVPLMGMLLIILISGFLAEGARLGILYPTEFSWYSPIGSVFAQVVPASPLFMQGMIRVHFLAVCVLIAMTPFSFLRHAVATPLNIFYKKQGPRAALRELKLEAGDIGARFAFDLSWKQLLDAEACVACGRCEENCPATISGKLLSPRKVMQQIYYQATLGAAQTGNGGLPEPLRLDNAISPEEFWACTTCMACVAHCPVCAEPLDKIIDLRRYQVMGEGQLPVEAQGMIRNLDLYGDVQGKGAAHRADWAMHRAVPILGSTAAESDILLWVGCAGAYHPRNQQTSLAMVKILKSAGIRFAILGKAERCCGDPARRLGDETLFQRLAQQNMEQFNRYHVQTVVTLCPHCLNTLKNEYPALGCRLTVVHATEYILNLLNEQRLQMKYPLAKKLAVHDACYLGRYNGVYEAPRQLCRNVPGVMLSELTRSRENSFCCGGGGGRMWLHEHGGQNINVVRAEEIRESRVEIIGTSCPYCLVMLDDGVKFLELEKTPRVADIIDIVADALG